MAQKDRLQHPLAGAPCGALLRAPYRASTEQSALAPCGRYADAALAHGASMAQTRRGNGAVIGFRRSELPTLANWLSLPAP